ncbi:MAG: tRNA (N(6)-L-threonylcarbamoyladenosine(37)-C(2))-methylthiotransferase MtaB [Gammaproteobacteria bacterium]
MLIHLQALGCRLNEAELELWANGFRRQGHSLAPVAEDADVVVINTCAVTADAVRKSRQLVRKAHRANPRAKLIVSGCHASLSPDEVRTELGADLVVGNEDKDRLVDLAISALDLPTMPEAATEPAEVSLFQRGRQRAFIKVQDGCRYRCTYCIVTVARGEERSRPTTDVVEEINRLHGQGVNEVVITGVQVGGYGNGIGGSLPGLIRTVLKDTDVPRIRLGSVEPWSLDDDFFDLFSNARFMPHLHLPLQSGCDSVLRRMARKTRVADFEAMAERLRTAAPRFNLTTDIIVGFPGETDAEWSATVDTVQRIGFGHIHIFSYSDRAGTKAAGLPDKVDKAVKKQRSAQLHTLAGEQKRALLRDQVGSTAPILWERPTQGPTPDTRRWFGYTPNYLRVRMDANADLDLENTIVNVELTGMDPEHDVLMSNLEA